MDNAMIGFRAYITKKKTEIGRLKLLDMVRGITLISMILYHTCWDLYDFRLIPKGFVYGGWAYVWQQSICWTFIFLSGFCFHLGKHHLKRSLTVFLCGALVTGVTLLFMYPNRVIFGVLTMIGSAGLVTTLFDWIFPKSKKVAFFDFLLCLALFLVTRNIPRGGLGFENLWICDLPDGLYANYFTTFLGFPFKGFYSTDYFSLFPWYFLYLSGSFFYILLKGTKVQTKLLTKGIRPFTFIGRHSLILYMAHQPICYGIVYLISLM